MKKFRILQRMDANGKPLTVDAFIVQQKWWLGWVTCDIGDFPSIFSTLEEAKQFIAGRNGSTIIVVQ